MSRRRGKINKYLKVVIVLYEFYAFGFGRNDGIGGRIKGSDKGVEIKDEADEIKK